jgi:hypothetical protein
MRLGLIATSLLAALIAVTACSGDDGEPTVDVAEDVFEDELVVEPDPSGTSATVRVTTTLDMACAVVFGSTPDLGEGIATDSDMGGGAHTDHDVTLAGLEPDTEYYFRVQGSGADGRLFRSDLMTFRTPETAEPGASGENVAAGAAVVDVSSEFSDAFAAANAIDADPATEWSTAGDGDDAWIIIDLGEDVDIAGIGLFSREMSDGTAIIESYSVTVDDDEVLGPFPAGPGGSLSEVEVTGQVLRFDADTTTGGNTGAVEIEVRASSRR